MTQVTIPIVTQNETRGVVTIDSAGRKRFIALGATYPVHYVWTKDRFGWLRHDDGALCWYHEWSDADLAALAYRDSTGRNACVHTSESTLS